MIQVKNNITENGEEKSFNRNYKYKNSTLHIYTRCVKVLRATVYMGSTSLLYLN